MHDQSDGVARSASEYSHTSLVAYAENWNDMSGIPGDRERYLLKFRRPIKLYSIDAV